MLQTFTEAELAALPEKARAALIAARVQLEELEAKNARLDHLLRELQKALFGKRSEKLDPAQRSLLFEDLEVAVAEEETKEDVKTGRPPRSPRRNLGSLPKHLPRIERVIEPESTACPKGCGEMVRIGEDRTERLDIIPAQFRVIATTRPRYACKACENGVAQAPSTPHLIEGGMPTEALIAHVLVSKYADHCPLYRQTGIFSRSGIDLDRSTLAGWVGKAAFHLSPVIDQLSEHLKTAPVLQMDETPLPVLDPGRGRTKTGYLWPILRDQRAWGGADPPSVVYHYAPSRAGRHAEDFLKGFTGTLQVDGYRGYDRFSCEDRKGGPLRVTQCWAHSRRGLMKIFEKDGSPIAAEGLKRIAAFYEIEAKVWTCLTKVESASDNLGGVYDGTKQGIYGGVQAGSGSAELRERSHEGAGLCGPRGRQIDDERVAATIPRGRVDDGGAA